MRILVALGRPVVWLQERFARAMAGTGYTLLLIGKAFLRAPLAFRRRREIGDFLFTATLGSLPLIVFTALFTGMIIALQTGIELERFGQAETLGIVVPVTVCRGMGPVFTAIAVTGLIGSTVAAHIATMKISEEIDALEVMSIDPVYFLVMPRVLGLALALPVLTVYTDIIGSLGGALVAYGKFSVSFDSYFNNARDFLTLKDFYGGLLKAAVFGVTIAGIASGYGLRARHGAQGVGLATLKTVVMSFIFILVLEYILTWFIYQKE